MVGRTCGSSAASTVREPSADGAIVKPPHVPGVRAAYAARAFYRRRSILPALAGRAVAAARPPHGARPTRKEPLVIYSRRRIVVGVLSLVAMLIGLAPATGAQEPVLSVETAIDLQSVRDAVIDPSGRLVAYVVSVPPEGNDDSRRSGSEIWITSIDGGEARRFTTRGRRSSDPQWSPDGKTLAFLSTRDDLNEHTQIYLIARDGGEANLLTGHETSIGISAGRRTGGRSPSALPIRRPRRRRRMRKPGATGPSSMSSTRTPGSGSQTLRPANRLRCMTGTSRHQDSSGRPTARRSCSPPRRSPARMRK